MSKSLAKNSLFTLISNVALAASNWLVLVLIAKFFEVSDLGAFVLALSLFSPAFLLASFKVRTLLIVDKDWDFKPEDYGCARIFANTIVTVVVVAIASVVYQELPIWLLLTVAVYKMADAWSEFTQSYLRRHQHFQVISISTSARALVTICSLLSAIAIDVHFEVIILIWTGFAVFFSLVDTWLMLKFWEEPALKKFRFSKLFSIAVLVNALQIYRRQLTIAVALAISALFVHLPNFALAHYFSPSEAGIFATISYFLVAGGILINSLSQAGTPQLVNLYKTGSQRAFMRLTFVLCCAGTVLAVLGVSIALVLGKWILALFYTPEIAEFDHVLVWVMIASGIRFLYIFLGTALAALQRFKSQTYINFFGFLTLLVALYLWVPEQSLLGAAKAMTLAAVVECILYLAIFRNRVKSAFTVAAVN
jgi:O-antigen/teichoic acid export membrane protein